MKTLAKSVMMLAVVAASVSFASCGTSAADKAKADSIAAAAKADSIAAAEEAAAAAAAAGRQKTCCTRCCYDGQEFTTRDLFHNESPFFSVRRSVFLQTSISSRSLGAGHLLCFGTTAILVIIDDLRAGKGPVYRAELVCVSVLIIEGFSGSVQHLFRPDS